MYCWQMEQYTFASTVRPRFQWTSFFFFKMSLMIKFVDYDFAYAYNKTPPNIPLHILIYLKPKVTLHSELLNISLLFLI